MSDPIEAAILGFARKSGALQRGATVLVAVSGGQDSCALLHALAAAREKLGIGLHAAHLDHGFRGEESAADAGFVRALAASLEVDCTVENRDVPAAARRLLLSAQEAARRERREFLQRVAAGVGASQVALAHTRDDQVETVLLRILRGTGVDGLRAMRSFDAPWIRPLLTVAREETGAYCERHAIPYRTDSSNASLRYRRNRARTELLPHLESYYNANIRAAILRLADTAGEDSDHLNRLTSGWLGDNLERLPGDKITLPLSDLRALPKALQRRAIRGAVRVVRGDLSDVELAGVDAVLLGLEEHCGDRIAPGLLTVPGDCVARVLGDKLVIERRPAAKSARPIEYALVVPGDTVVPEWGLVVRVDTRPRGADDPERAGGYDAVFDAAAIALPLLVRSRRPGDRLRPLGMTGSRKLQDILTDKKVAAERRDALPIVADADGPVWVMGVVLADRVKVTANTRSVLTLEVTASRPTAEAML